MNAIHYLSAIQERRRNMKNMDVTLHASLCRPLYDYYK